MSLPLAYREFGAGRPLLILHGLFGSATNWKSVARRFASICQVYTLDLRNHGDSPWASTMAYADMADDLRFFITQHDLGKPAVLGHSMGGKAAMLLALSYPDSVGALVVVDVAPVSYSHSFLPYVNALRDIDLSGVTRRVDVDVALSQQIPENDVRQFLLQNLVRRDGRFDWRVNLLALATNMREITGFPDMPDGKVYEGKTLFLHGTSSDFVTPEHHAVIKRLFPRADIVGIQDAGHWIHVDQPEPFVHRITDFLH